MIKNFKDLIAILGGYKFWYVFSAVLLLVSIVARALEPKILQIAVDYVLIGIEDRAASDALSGDFITNNMMGLLPETQNGKVGAALLALGFLYMIIAIVRSIFLFSSVTLKDSITERSIKRLRDNVFKHIQYLPLEFFSGISRGELIQRCTGDIDTIKRFIHQQVVAVLRLSGTFLFSFAMMWSMDWLQATLSIILSPLILYLGFRFFNEERKIWRLHEIEADKLNNMVQENLNGIRVVTAFSNQENEIDRFHRQNQRKMNMGLRQANLHAIYWPLTDFLVHLQLIISVLTGGYFVIQGRISVGELLGFYTYIGMVTYPMRQLGKVLSQMGMAVVATSRISEIMEYKPEMDEGTYIADDILGDIEFRNVSFTYPNEKKPALQHISFRLKAGQQLGITGSSGAGKSTIIKLLLRLYEPTEGVILLDGKDIKSYPKAYLRATMGVAMQKAFLFSRTLEQNIAYVHPQSTQYEIDEAARISEAYEMKLKFPDGFKTLVGEKGVTLSGGQKQRVVLARTLIKWPGVVIIDDATSAIDTVTEHKILKSLQSVLDNRTSIIISHRVASLKKSDIVLVMQEGKMAQYGSPIELESMEDGYYNKICQIQSVRQQDKMQEYDM
ncbi:MAG: ABC transporter ATP-binding protein [Cyclobacteriaceae bacterium]